MTARILPHTAQWQSLIFLDDPVHAGASESDYIRVRRSEIRQRLQRSLAVKADRLACHGVAVLSDAELVSVVLSASRGRSTLDTARAVLSDGLLALARRDWRTYARVIGIGEGNATKIAGAFELGRPASSCDLAAGDPICGAGPWRARSLRGMRIMSQSDSARSGNGVDA